MKCTTSPGQNRPESNGHEVILHTIKRSGTGDLTPVYGLMLFWYLQGNKVSNCEVLLCPYQVYEGSY